MREILFRGKSNCSYGKVKKGDWLYGMTISRHCYDDEEIISYYIGSGNNTIDGKTLGQYTGLTDKNGKKIFEGDIVTHFINWLGKRINGVVKYDNKVASWVCDFAPEKESAFLADWVDGNGCEIVGNIYDNPELLKGGE